MKRIPLLVASGAVALTGCQRDDSALKEELAGIRSDLAEIKEALKSGARPAARAQRPRRPRPNPNEVYAAPIAGAPFRGVEDAKVTVVEAFEFA